VILRPPEPKSEMVAHVIVDGNTISTKLPERLDSFVDLVRELGYRWNGGSWVRSCGSLAGDPQDRAAELCHNLVAGGFCVEVSEPVAKLALDGLYKPECKRWILAAHGSHDGWFRLWWARGEDCYHEARKLTGSRYDHSARCTVVPPEMFLEVEDFARLQDFQFSDKATVITEKARQRRAGAVIADLKIETGNGTGRRPTLKAKDAPIDVQFLDILYHDFATTTDLYPHQRRATDKLAMLRVGALFMEMGTGKTRVAIELAHLRRHRVVNVVWFCPVSLKETIAHEIRKHTDAPGDQICVFDDKTNMRNVPSVFWYIVGIESMSSSDRVVLTANSLIGDDSFVVVDESSYIKGHNATRTKRITRLSEHARYRLILTGTPLSQGVVDLYAQMRFLSPGILNYPSFYSFAHNHLEYSKKYPDLIVRSHNTEWLAAKIQPFVYQVTKDECLDLPPKLFDERRYRMTGEQRDLYEQAKWELLFSIPDDDIDSYVIFRLFTALQQIVSGFWNRKLDDGETETIEIEYNRLECLMDAINSIPTGEKVIVWCKYIHSLERITQALADNGDGVALYYGGLNEKERAWELERFRGDARFLVATQATGGHGLTLNEARFVVFYENGFKYSHRPQAEDRCHRIGQESRVTYIDLVCSGSIDERIRKALADKENVVRAFKRQVDRVKDKRQELERMVKEL